MVSDSPSAGSLVLAHAGAAAPIWVSEGDWPGVLRAGRDLQADVERVTGIRPVFSTGQPSTGPDAVFVGTLGRSALIDGLVASGKVDAGALRGKWESFLIQVVDNPVPGVARALVVAGSDKRGAIYGIYEVSEQIGVSPWYWWADVPVRHRDSIFVPPVRRIEGEPAVRYRGIFLNDEAPELSSWAKQRFGGFNHQFYAGIFELLLRMRANYLWPAMWDNAFNEDDPENPRLADEYGIVMGTSHHEPMMRAQQEWKRHGSGPWNFADNADELTRFWTEGVRRNRSFESITTIGMRGDGDMPMSEQSDIDLLQRIVGVQRGILAKEVNPDVSRVPQLWALYKEVQDYFEKGMRVPDDVTLLWCDDNWGNIRRLPTPAERQRAGGAGIYYHFDYVGGPRSYKWVNTYPITKVWEQMHLAWQYGADRIWIVNVGSLKPREFPIEFFLRYAWAPDRWPSERLGEYGRLWAAREFGPENAQEIAGIMEAYTKFNGRRKPEHVGPGTFSLFNYDEARRVESEWKEILIRATLVRSKLAPAAQDAFDELFMQQAAASGGVTNLNIAAARNRLYAVQGRASANIWAATARDLFEADAAYTKAWDKMLGGKWRHFMDQTHLGYTTWQQPVRNAMPAVTELQVPRGGALGVAIDGSPNSWPTDNGGTPPPVLPELSPYSVGSTYVEVFDRGLGPLDYRIQSNVPWLHVLGAGGVVTPDSDASNSVTVDWGAVPAGRTVAAITVTSGDGAAVHISVPVTKPEAKVSGFVEAGGCVAIEAPHFDRAVASGGIEWKVLDDYGPSLGAVTPLPVTAESQVPGGASPHLEYDIFLFSSGASKIDVSVAPTLNFVPGHGLRFAVSLDDEAPQVEEYAAQVGGDAGGWAESVLDGVRHVVSAHKAVEPGRHVLKVWRVDPGVVLERIVVDMGGVRPSYLGPPESFRAAPKAN
jgi:Glycosyl hydrolase family 115/Gylcosyl hydrolase family 115 C-terminal domain